MESESIVDFKLFRPDLALAVPVSDGSKGGRPSSSRVFGLNPGWPSRLRGSPERACASLVLIVVRQ